MTEEQRAREDVAWQAWRDAEKAYRDEQDRYVTFWWESDPQWTPPEPVDLAAYERLSQLREAAQQAHEAYRATAREASSKTQAQNRPGTLCRGGSFAALKRSVDVCAAD